MYGASLEFIVKLNILHAQRSSGSLSVRFAICSCHYKAVCRGGVDNESVLCQQQIALLPDVFCPAFIVSCYFACCMHVYLHSCICYLLKMTSAYLSSAQADPLLHSVTHKWVYKHFNMCSKVSILLQLVLICKQTQRLGESTEPHVLLCALNRL